MDVKFIYSIDETNYIPTNDDENYMHKYYVPFLSSNNHEYLSYGSEYDSVKRRVCFNKNIILDLLLNK